MFNLSRCRIGWHKWLSHGDITTGLKRCKRCNLVRRYMPALKCPPMPPMPQLRQQLAKGDEDEVD